MIHLGAQQVAILLLIAVLIVGIRRFSRLGFGTHDLAQLAHELLRQMPVYSAETVRGKEAEFIRDRLPKLFPTLLAVLALLLFGGLLWWLRHA